MAFIVADRVMESSTTTGTGAFTLAGAYTAYRTFGSVMSTSDTTKYVIEAIDANGNPTGAWEVGIGTYSGTNTLTRTSVEASSNSNNAVDFAAGTKRVMMDASAALLNSFLKNSNNLSDVSNADTARGNLTAAKSGAVTGSGLTQATSRLLGRTTASTGAIEEISVSAPLTLSSGALGLSSYEAGPPTPPTTADLATWDNQGTSTASDGTGALIFRGQADGVIHGLIKATPSTPFTVYCRVDVGNNTTLNVGTAYNTVGGILFKDTGGDNERLTFFILNQHDVSGGDDVKTYATGIQRWTGASPPVFSSTPVIKYNSKPWKWIKVEFDGTTFTMSAGFDGKNWESIGTETLAAFIDGAASYGVFHYGSAGGPFAQFGYFSTTAPA